MLRQGRFRCDICKSYGGLLATEPAYDAEYLQHLKDCDDWDEILEATGHKEDIE